jgi:hypothetical protein
MINKFFIFILLINISYISLSNTTKRINYTSLFFNSSIETINNTNFDRVIKKGIKNPYLILFTVIRCKICNQVIKIMEKVEEYLIKKNSNIKVVKVDCGGNIWTVMRFDIDHIPKIIYVENNKMSYLNDNITYDNIIEFLNNENKIKIPFLKPMNYIDFFKKIFNALNEFLTDYTKINGIKWNKKYTGLVIILILIIFMIIEYYIMKYCCTTQRKSKTHFHNKKHHVHTNNEILKKKNQ